MVDPNILNVTNAHFVDDLYAQWTEDASSVPDEWARYFSSLENGHGYAPATTAGAVTQQEPSASHRAEAAAAGVSSDVLYAYKQSRVDSLMWAYRDIGYIYATLNPLERYSTPELHYMRYTIEGNYESLALKEFGLSDEDLDTEFATGRYLKPERMTLREILATLKEIYCSTMGVEILHIQNKPMRRWLIEKMESPPERVAWSPERKVRFQKDLIKAEEFERFLQSNFIGQKRFSLEGGEALVPAVHYLIMAAAERGLQEIVIGMAHRGRLNLFTNALRKPGAETFSKFIDNYQPHEFGGTGDVKYHLGHSFDYKGPEGRKIHISLVANPSHLESVDPVVEGKARGIQRRRGDVNRKKVMPVLIHGDAAFSGQGIVAETFNLSQLKGYRTGGTVHIILNNQIGFTTASRDARSTFFATDVAKSIPIPIFHVNGDDPEAVVRAIDLAMRFRHKFGYDAVVDIQCYRRLGHNEADEPSFTHPIMYSMIKNHPSVANLYGRRLNKNGVYSEEDQNSFQEKYVSVLKEELDKAKSGYKPHVNDAYEGGEWKQIVGKFSFDPVETGVPEKKLRDLGKRINTIPENFDPQRKLERLVRDRLKAIENGEGIDWANAESLAFASLLVEGHPIRLSGEDCARGTFSQRHAVWWHISAETPTTHTPLRSISDDQAPLSVYDSPLSESSESGFDYGYSLAQPKILTIWEAQFGDFVNGAQVIIDQFISAGESKWFRSSGLVMLLPHGYEGQGPEHSSAHLERFLQLAADENMQICNASTPAQYFHLLRRQLLQPFRKPLIVMTPKSLLRHKMAVSKLSEMGRGSFQTIIPEANPAKKTKLLLLCCGKVYYDLVTERENRGRDDVDIVRFEQLYPFDRKRAEEILAPYKGVDRVVWVQEESRNRGAWSFIRDHVADYFDGKMPDYAGREPSPSPATGSYKQHSEELAAFLDEAFAPPKKR